MAEVKYYWGTGRRKTSVARVRIKDGSGQITVNDRPCQQYFTIERDRQSAQAPLVAAEVPHRYDVIAKVHGGGIGGQAGAMLLGLARALKEADPGLEEKLRARGYLTRDGRMKERKKYGKKGARASFQFSKR